MRCEVSFKLASRDRPLILLPVAVNGDGPYQFALDTGACLTVVSRHLAERLGIRVLEEREGYGAGGKLSLGVSRVRSLSIGLCEVNDLEIAVMDLSDLSTMIGEEIVGVLGHNFLANFKLTIDYGRRVVVFEPLKWEVRERRPKETF